MTGAPDWWRRPRRVSVVIDNESWILPYGEALVAEVTADGDDARLYRSYAAMGQGDIAFFLGCTGIAGPETLSLHRYNLVVHESDLPHGRGFAPLAWQIIEGSHTIPICLLEAADEADAGDVYYRDAMQFEGHELMDELRQRQGATTVALCQRFLAAPAPPEGRPQSGDATHYRRRRPVDSRLDPQRSIAEQFDLLRTVDNQRHPAFFELRGNRYRLSIVKDPDVGR